MSFDEKTPFINVNICDFNVSGGEQIASNDITIPRGFTPGYCAPEQVDESKD